MFTETEAKSCQTEEKKREEERSISAKSLKYVRVLGVSGGRGENNETKVNGLRYDDVDWIYLAQHRIQWMAVVNTVMNLLPALLQLR